MELLVQESVHLPALLELCLAQEALVPTVVPLLIPACRPRAQLDLMAMTVLLLVQSCVEWIPYGALVVWMLMDA